MIQPNDANSFPDQLVPEPASAWQRNEFLTRCMEYIEHVKFAIGVIEVFEAPAGSLISARSRMSAAYECIKEDLCQCGITKLPFQHVESKNGCGMDELMELVNAAELVSVQGFKPTTNVGYVPEPISFRKSSDPDVGTFADAFDREFREIRDSISRFQRCSSAFTQTEDQALVDGPAPPDAFIWKGKRYVGLKPIDCSLLNHCWNSPGRVATGALIMEPVYGDREINPFEKFENAIPSSATRIRKFLRDKNGIPISVTVNKRCQTVMVTVDNSE